MPRTFTINVQFNAELFDHVAKHLDKDQKGASVQEAVNAAATLGYVAAINLLTSGPSGFTREATNERKQFLELMGQAFDNACKELMEGQPTGTN